MSAWVGLIQSKSYAYSESQLPAYIRLVWNAQVDWPPSDVRFEANMGIVSYSRSSKQMQAFGKNAVLFCMHLNSFGLRSMNAEIFTDIPLVCPSEERHNLWHEC
jgi:hypothetical protein